MKKILVTLIAVLTVGCSNPLLYTDNPEVPTFTSVDDAWYWVSSNIVYVEDELNGFYDTWQTPTETLALGTGDCEDFSLLLMYMLKQQGIESSLVISVDLNNGYLHVFVATTKELMEPQLYGVVYDHTYLSDKRIFVIAYDEAMQTAVNKKAK